MASPRVLPRSTYVIDTSDPDYHVFDDKLVNVRVAELNPYITCRICFGYLINATTITECSHTFCRTCIVMRFQSSNLCPQCDSKVHETQPLLKLRSDRAMQELVYKIVPGLVEKERKREADFYRSRGIKFARSGSHLLTIDAKQVAKEEPEEEDKQPPVRYDQYKYIDTVHDYNLDPKVTIKVTPRPSESVEDGTRYLVTPNRASVWNVKCLVKKILESDIGEPVNDDQEICLYCMGQLLVDDRVSMQQVAETYFIENSQADRCRPVVLEYSIVCK